MVSLSFNIDQRRPCYRQGEKAMFHGWDHVSNVIEPSILMGGCGGGVVSQTFAIIELQDGRVTRVMPEEIIFADGGDFNQTAFQPQK